MNVQKPYDAGKTSYNTQPRPAAQETQKKATTSAADNTDKFDPSAATYRNSYNKGAQRAENRQINNDEFRAKASASARSLKNDAVRNMVSSQISGQANKGAAYKPLFPNNPIISNALKAAEATSEKHSDYWGVEATAERIFTFASSLAGDDLDKLAKMKAAFNKGFSQAAGMWDRAGGGKLPPISYQTRDRVLEMFAAREKELAEKKPDAPVNNNQATNTQNNTHSGGKTIPIVGAGKYGATPAPTTFSGGNKVPHYGMAPPPAPKPEPPAAPEEPKAATGTETD
jgi:hypothetical protein